MVSQSLRTLGPLGLLLCVMSAPALAQSSAPQSSQPHPAAPAAPVDDLSIYPKNGQTEQQIAVDRSECRAWAKDQTGFDPTQSGGGVSPDERAFRHQQYRRAMTACLEARGYSVRFEAPTPYAPPPYTPPPYPAPAYGEPHYAEAKPAPPPELRYHPLAVQIDGGYSIPTGTTNQMLAGGANAGLGLTWFPSSSLPLGLRVDGSYSWFGAKSQLLNLNGAGFTSGHENIYGGDADLQLDLAHHSSRAKMYLFGGIGRYREQTNLRQVSLVNGSMCFPFICVPAAFPAVTATQHTTSPWLDSWNGGIGWEIALADRTSFFIEARYERILPYDSRMQFVPIRFGFRF